MSWCRSAGARARGCSPHHGRWRLHARSAVRRACSPSNWAASFPSPRRRTSCPRYRSLQQQTADAATIQEGEKLYKTFYCDGCHSRRTSTAAARGCSTEPFPICATRRPTSTPSGTASCWQERIGTRACQDFRDPPKFAFPHLRMSTKQADAIHAYVIDGAWKAYNQEQAAGPKQ